MATENTYKTTTRAAGADMNGAGFLYHAIAMDDGLVAANGGEAGGILLNKPKNKEHATLGVSGEMKYAAGAAIAAGAKLTVTASGWFTAASSGTFLVGRNKETAITSGSVGTGIFDFSAPVYQVSSL